MSFKNQSDLKRDTAFFHSLSKTLTEATQNVYESKYKSSHNIKSSEIWAEPIEYCADITAADIESGTNTAVTKYTLQVLTPIPGSNNQAWYLSTGSDFIRPWISPVDIVDTSNNPSNGFTAHLYSGDDATTKAPDTEITPTEGEWEIDYYAGIVKFSPDSLPTHGALSNQGWGTPKLTVYVYSGEFLDQVSVSSDLNLISQELTALQTVSNGDPMTSTGISQKPINNNEPQLTVNGVKVKISEDKLGYCYFSDDGGTTAKLYTEITANDILHWNETIAKYNIDIDDILEITYLIG